MHFSFLIHLACLFLTSFVSASTADEVQAFESGTPHYLRALAIVEDGMGHSKFQCWVFRTPFAVSTQPGTVGAATLDLAKLSNVTYAVIPAKFNGGTHNAPYNQIVYYMSGKGVFTLPNSPDTATINGGANGLLVATDLTGAGHITTYPSDEQTIAFELPFADGIVPKHHIQRTDGPCKAEEQIIYDM